MSIVLAEAPIVFERVYAADEDTSSAMCATGIAAIWETGLLSWISVDEELGAINHLEDGYVILRPIPYRISYEDDGTLVASFDEANIAIGGTDRRDAYQSLVAEILDTFDTLTREPRLVAAAAHQLEILRLYISRG
jgi:hypothetical protein